MELQRKRMAEHISVHLIALNGGIVMGIRNAEGYMDLFKNRSSLHPLN